MVTRSTHEAMALLREKRRFLIAYGRHVAADLCRINGVVHSREVRRVMAEKGLLDDPDLNDYWLGVIFRDVPFEWTGEFYAYSDDVRNIHERTIKVWRLHRGREQVYRDAPVFDDIRAVRIVGLLSPEAIVVRLDVGGYVVYE